MIVQSESGKKAILAALADEVIEILDSVMYQSKSVKGIISENNTSYTSAYRKIKWLLNQ